MSKQTTIIDRLAQSAGISKLEAERQFKNVFTAVADELKESKMVKVPGFGSFNKSPLKRSSTLFGKQYDVDTNVVRFSAFKKLKTSINS